MPPTAYRELLNLARRHSRKSGEEEDLVQEALLAAVLQGRTDLDNPDTRRWLAGVIRYRGRFEARTAARRRLREQVWSQAHRQADLQPDRVTPAEATAGLPSALRVVVLLALTGHNRREIAYLLGLSDATLRQRIRAVKRRLTAAGLAAPAELSGLNLDLAYGRIRDVLLPELQRQGGLFASHDPDGHLFVVSRSRNGPARQR
jgi:RNA polymerase sigma-70 factor (ECF subfamily)